MPSTTNSFPGYACAVVRLLSMCRRFLVGPGDLEAERLAEHLLERRHVPMGGPELQLRVAVRPETSEVVVAARVEIEATEGLGVAAIQALGQAHDRRQCLDGPAQRSAQVAVTLVSLFRGRLPVISRDERDHLGLLRLEAAKIAVLDQVVRVTVMPLVADVNADVVEERAVLQPLAFPFGQAVHAARL